MKFRRTRRRDTTLDITPMIDVVFQLVLFFMVTTNFVTAPEGIQVDLPRADAEAVVVEAEDVNLWVSSDGAVYLDDQPVDLAALRRRLEAAANHDTSTLVVIKADAGVSHGRVVALMDVARSYGLSRLAIATDPDGSPASEPGR